MQTLAVDVSVQQSLAAVHSLTEIVDAQGNVLGYYSPASQRAAALYAEAAAHFDPLEMQRRKQSAEKGLTTPEVLKHLESLER